MSLQEPCSQVNNEQDIILPSQAFKTHFENIFRAINIAIPHFFHEKSIKKKVIKEIESIQEHPIGCEVHLNDDNEIKGLDSELCIGIVLQHH